MNFKNTAKSVSLVVEDYLYKKGVKEERKRRDCLRYKYPKQKEKQLRPAFSLVEMLMALLVASLLLAALASVMTRKFNDNINISANSTTQSKGWRLYTYSSDCNKAEGKDNVCEFKDFTVPKGVSFINLIMVSGGGGGAGAAQETKIQASPVQITGTTSKDEIKTIPITEYMTDVKVTLAGAGGGGAGETMAKIKNLSLPSDKECIIRVGGGGNYGSGQNDKNGGNTSIKCGNAKEYIIHGGEGGKLGASGTSVTNPKPVGGSGGNRGKVSENIIQLGTLAEIIYGEGLYSGTTQETALKINGNLNIGGNGGKSGTDATGGCGGLRPNGDPDCTNGNVNATPGEYFTPTYTGLTANTPDYGKTGAGGAGGGWNANQSPKQGTGSSGNQGIFSYGGNRNRGGCK